VVHPGAPTEPLPASHLVIGRTVGDPLARRGHFAYRLRADGAHTPWTSQHVSVVSLQMLQAMLAEDIAPLVGPKGHHNPDRTAPRRGSEVGRGDPWRPPGVDQRALVRFGSVPPWSSGDPRRARAVTTSTTKRQVTAPSRQNLGRWSTAEEVRIRPDGCRGPAALANEGRVALDGPHPLPEVVPSPPGRSRGRPHRPCHLSAIPSTTPLVHRGQPWTLLTA
jgi:hypothetical protein